MIFLHQGLPLTTCATQLVLKSDMSIRSTMVLKLSHLGSKIWNLVSQEIKTVRITWLGRWLFSIYDTKNEKN